MQSFKLMMVDRQILINKIRKVYRNLSDPSVEKLHKILDILNVDGIVDDGVVRLYCYVTMAAAIESTENAMYGIKKFTQADKKKFVDILLMVDDV